MWMAPSTWERHARSPASLDAVMFCPKASQHCTRPRIFPMVCPCTHLEEGQKQHSSQRRVLLALDRVAKRLGHSLQSPPMLHVRHFHQIGRDGLLPIAHGSEATRRIRQLESAVRVRLRLQQRHQIVQVADLCPALPGQHDEVRGEVVRSMLVQRERRRRNREATLERRCVGGGRRQRRHGGRRRGGGQAVRRRARVQVQRRDCLLPCLFLRTDNDSVELYERAALRSAIAISSAFRGLLGGCLFGARRRGLCLVAVEDVEVGAVAAAVAPRLDALSADWLGFVALLGNSSMKGFVQQQQRMCVVECTAPAPTGRDADC